MSRWQPRQHLDEFKRQKKIAAFGVSFQRFLSGALYFWLRVMLARCLAMLGLTEVMSGTWTTVTWNRNVEHQLFVERFFFSRGHAIHFHVSFQTGLARVRFACVSQRFYLPPALPLPAQDEEKCPGRSSSRRCLLEPTKLNVQHIPTNSPNYSLMLLVDAHDPTCEVCRYRFTANSISSLYWYVHVWDTGDGRTINYYILGVQHVLSHCHCQVKDSNWGKKRKTVGQHRLEKARWSIDGLLLGQGTTGQGVFGKFGLWCWREAET